MKPVKNHTLTTLLITGFCLFAPPSFAQRAIKVSRACNQNDLFLVNVKGCVENTANPGTKWIGLMPYDILPYPVKLNAGGDASICSTASYDLNGSGPANYKTLWSTGGDGAFDDPTSPHTTYHPGDYDKTTGNVALTLTALPHAGLDRTPTSGDLLLNLQVCIIRDDADEY